MAATSSTSAAGGPPMRRVGLSVVIGTTIEWYDFQIYGLTAALVFAPLFFPEQDPTAGTLLAFSTFVVGFLARPVGGVIFGHLGDRFGRKRMLVVALTLMGVATFIIGLLPTYASIGIAAPLLLVLMRILQGLGVGGEWGGAVLTAVEYSSKEKRGFFGSLPQVGVPAGLLLATIASLSVAQLPDEQFFSWGWRIPFLVSIVLVGIGLFVRLKLDETPTFKRMQKTNTGVRVPLITAVRSYPRQVLLATGSMISTGAFFYIVNTYALSYATDTDALTRTETLIAIGASAVAAAIALPYFGALGQRWGRKRLILFGLAAMGVWIFPVFLAVNTSNLALVLVIYVIGAVLFSVSYGPQATFLAELFDTRVRYSAAGVSFQLGVLIGGSFAPLIATALFAASGTYLSVAGYVAAVSLLSFVSVFLVTSRDLDTGSQDLETSTRGGASSQ